MQVSLANKSLITKIVPENDVKHFLLLLVFGAIMLFIRILPVYTKIFTNWPGEYGNFVNFSADDAIYHMRLVHNTLHHFPWRIFFDPFTHFPYGSHIAFGPLFTIIIAAVALIVGLGHPSPELINHVGAYIPPVMGALCLIPLYFITRKLFGKTTALLAAFVLTFLPGEFLNRSALGFADHHVAEVLFSTTTCAFLVYALSVAKSPEARTKTLFHSLFAGITLGLFILIWQGALMFGVIFLLFFIIQLLIDHIKNNDAGYLLLLASLTYIPPMIIILPYAFINPLTLYPSSNILILIAIITTFIICYLLHVALKHRQLTRDLYPLALGATLILIIFILKRFFPEVYINVSRGCKMLFHPTPGMLTVSEVRSTIVGYDGKLTMQFFWHNLFWSMPLAFIGLGRLSYSGYKKQNPAEVFLLVWTLAIIAATCAQIRFNYYLAINIAILAGYGVYSLLEWISSLNFKNKLYLKLQKFISYAVFFLITFAIADPILMLLMDNSIPSGAQIKREWYNTLIWLKKQTPDPQGKVINKDFSYTFGYYPIPENLNEPYNYPKSTYGVMSWWDVGHQITYIAERIPNANPFQMGIIEKNGTAGAAMFFTTTSEKEAVNNLDEVGARYIAINSNMIAQFRGMEIWRNNTKGWNKLATIKTKTTKKAFLHSMINRLFYDDANGLQHFRLIYESDGDYYVKAMAKIFEKVKGAVIKGKAPKNIADNTQVKLNLKLKTKDSRVFAYEQQTKVKTGEYKFIVPYPTTQMKGDNYNYDIKSIGDYQIKINDYVARVFVPERAVMQGKVCRPK